MGFFCAGFRAQVCFLTILRRSQTLVFMRGRGDSNARARAAAAHSKSGVAQAGLVRPGPRLHKLSPSFLCRPDVNQLPWQPSREGSTPTWTWCGGSSGQHAAHAWGSRERLTPTLFRYCRWASSRRWSLTGSSWMQSFPRSARITPLCARCEHCLPASPCLSPCEVSCAACPQLTRKYGEFWNRSLQQLKKQRTQKENLLKECATAVEPAKPVDTASPALSPAPNASRRIKFQMELFNLHIQQGRDLCSKLSVVASHIKTAPAQLQSQLAIEVVSPILANSNNPLSTAR